MRRSTSRHWAYSSAASSPKPNHCANRSIVGIHAQNLALVIAGSGTKQGMLHGLLPDKPCANTTVTFLICCPAAAQFAAWADSVPEFTALAGIDAVFTNDPLAGLCEKIVTEPIGNPRSRVVTIYFDTWGPSLSVLAADRGLRRCVGTGG